MSLFNFFHSYLQENPDLLKINNFTRPLYYEQFYLENRKTQKRFEIEAFLSPMFNEHIVKCSTTIKEYEELNEKMRRISQVAQKMFTISLLSDKLEKEKYSDLMKEKLVELSNLNINK